MLHSFDVGILNFIQEHFRCGFLDTVMPFITHFADDGLFWIFVAVLLICIKKTRRVGFSLALAVSLGYIIGNLTLKPLIARVRPYDAISGIELLVGKLSDYSFPSGHTLVSFEGAVVMWQYDKRYGIPALVLEFIIAFSRMYLFVHYPTDVICGALLGTLFAIVAYKFVDYLYRCRRLKSSK